MKKFLFLLTVLSLSAGLLAAEVSKDQCVRKGDKYIYAGDECIQFYVADGDKESALTILVHGTWRAGTNTLGRYGPFADNLAMMTDITTVAVALPGYSGSSSNKLKALIHKDKNRPQAATRAYVEFLGELVLALKKRFNAKEVTLVGHSAGAMMSATLLGLRPGLINNIALAGGKYDIHKTHKDRTLISAVDVLGKIPKSTKILLIYGTEDTISKPETTIEFYKIAKEAGLNVRLVKAEGAAHIDLDMTDAATEAIVKMVEEE